MGRGRAPPPSNRCRSQSSNWDWDKDVLEHSGESEDDDQQLDATAATLPAPSHQIHALPALWVSSRRRHHRGRSRRRSTSETYQQQQQLRLQLQLQGSSSGGRPSSGFRALGGSPEQLRAATTAITATSTAITATAITATASATLNQRLRITRPDGPPFGGWVRGQAADVQWQALDARVQSVRIDVCNVAWTVPTTIAQRVANDGAFHWRRVYWGMPIAEGYYVNIYDVTAPKESSEAELLAQSERFAVIK